MKNTSLTLKSIALFASTMLASPGFLSAQTVVNGSFESGIDPSPDFIDVAAVDSSTITGWTVSSGSIDYIGGRWASADGSRSIDMNGSSAGTLTQTITGLSSGQSYHLFFFMAASPDAGAGVSRSMQVSMGASSQIFSAISTGSISNPGWTQRQMDFTASGSSMNLSFASLVSGNYGATLDAVSIVPVPEPGIFSLGFAGLGLALFARRKQFPAKQ